MLTATAEAEGPVPLLRVNPHLWEAVFLNVAPGTYYRGLVFDGPYLLAPYLIVQPGPVLFASPGILNVQFDEGDESLAVELRRVLFGLAA
jgi:hypothetical protein